MAEPSRVQKQGLREMSRSTVAHTGRMSLNEKTPEKGSPKSKTPTKSVPVTELKDIIFTVKIMFGAPRRLPLEGVATTRRPFGLVDTPTKVLHEVNKEKAMVDNLEVTYDLSINDNDDLKDIYLTFTDAGGNRQSVILRLIEDPQSPFHATFNAWKAQIEGGQLQSNPRCNKDSNPNIHGTCMPAGHGPEIHVYMKNDVKMAKHTNTLQCVNEINEQTIKDNAKTIKEFQQYSDRLLASNQTGLAALNARNAQLAANAARITALEDEIAALRLNADLNPPPGPETRARRQGRRGNNESM